MSQDIYPPVSGQAPSLFSSTNVPANRLASQHILRYDVLTRVLHWIFATVIIYATVIGYVLAKIGNRAEHDLLSMLNESFATVLLMLFPFRLWRIIRRKRTVPAPISGIPLFQQKLAHTVHGLMYLTIACVLVSGYLMIPNGYSFFGLVTIPTPFSAGRLTHALFLTHRVSCAVLAAFIVLHVLAVIKHQLMGRKVLRRML